MHQNVKWGRGGAGGWGAGGWGAHRIVHKIEENLNFWNGCHGKKPHVGKLSDFAHIISTYGSRDMVACTNITKLVLHGLL